MAAVIDPAITTTRSGRPLVAVVPVDAQADAALASRVRDALHNRFLVIPSRFANADATVLVGDALPVSLDGLSNPTFAVTHGDARSVRLASVRAPASASVHAPIRIDVTAEQRGAHADPLSIALRHGGVVVDRVIDSVSSAYARVHRVLTFVPTQPGTVRLRVVASRGAGGDTATADLLVAVTDTPLPVLVFDPRPSYQSTFVRRALERDARLRITSRTVTSRNISTSAGRAPLRLDDAAELSRFDAIVVGAPDALTDRDVATLGRYLRERGGRVLLLLDMRTRGPYERLTGVREWRYRDVDRGTRIVPVSGDTAWLRASQQYAPVTLPDGAIPLALAQRTASDSGAVAAGDPVLWATSVGAGRLVVSGALDAWRYREREVSAFDRVWQQLVVEAAATAVPPVSVTLARSVLAPNEETVVHVTVRSAALGDAATGDAATRASAALVVGESGSEQPINLWPSGQPGQLVGSVRAPAESGSAHLVVIADGHRSETPIFVDGARQHAAPDGRALLTAWVAVRGGQLAPASQLEAFSRTLAESVPASVRAERWHPMRSLWWLLPFVLALSTEWWLRRRGGLA